MQSNVEFTYSESEKQKINFTLFAPSGSGGAIISEILDEHRSEHGDRMTDNYRNVMTNEYAGSPNCYRYYDYDAHYVMNEFPEWNEKTILYGKDTSPLKFYKNCKIKSPKLYYIDVTGHETLLKELVFMKKFVGGSIFSNGIGRIFQTIAGHEFKLDDEAQILRDKNALSLFEHRLEKIAQEYDNILNVYSPIVQNVLLKAKLNPTYVTKHEIQKNMVDTYKVITQVKPTHWTDVDEVKDYTDIHIIKYDDLLNGRDTDTKLDDHKDELKEYFERNSETLDRLLSLMNI